MIEPQLFQDDDRDPTDLGLSPREGDPPPHRCDHGWLGEDESGDLIPCLRCRPHLHRTTTGWTVTRPTPLEGRQ